MNGLLDSTSSMIQVHFSPLHVRHDYMCRIWSPKISSVQKSEMLISSKLFKKMEITYEGNLWKQKAS